MRKITSKIIIIVLIILAIHWVSPALIVFADDTNELNGEGTIDNPYQIYNKDDFSFFIESVNSGNSYYNQYVQLMNDIDMQYVEMQPIGVYDSGLYFWGTFDGDGHVLKNISIVSDNNAGLFGQLGGTVMNLGLESGHISGNGCNGAIASHSISSQAMIINCYSKVSVQGYRAGGLVDNFDGTVLNCWSDCELDSIYNATGGVYSYSCSTVDYCYSTQELSSKGNIISLNSQLLTSEYINSTDMIDLLNQNLSDNLSYDYRSRVDASKLNMWSNNYGSISFSSQKSTISNNVRYKNIIFVISYFVIFLVLLSIMFFIYKQNKMFKLAKNDLIVLSSGSIILISFVSFIVLMIINRGDGFNQIFFKDTSDTFMDFYNSVYDAARRKPYEHGVIYPAICNVIFYIASRFVPYKYFAGKYVFPGGTKIRTVQGVRFAFILFLAITFILLYIFIRYLFNNREKIVQVSVIVSVFFSFPFLYAFERGNIILLSFAGILIFLVTYKSDNKVIRELGLISLAIGADIKIYPVLFGLVLLSDKRFKDSVKAIVYGSVFFFVPFVFFGGKDAFLRFLRNITGFSGVSGGTGIGSVYKYNINPVGIFSSISGIFGIDFSHTQLLSTAIGLLLVLISLFEIKKWKKLCMITCGMLCIMTTVYTYSLIYMLLPWLFLIRERNEKWSKIDCFYNLLFILLFSSIPLGMISRSKYYTEASALSTSFVLLTIVITIFCVTLIVEFLYNRFTKKIATLLLSFFSISICLFIIISCKLTKGLPINNGVYVNLSTDFSTEKSEYIISGLDSFKDGYTWTISKTIKFSFLETDPGDNYNLIINIHDTYFEGNSQEIVVYDGKDEIYRCVVSGESVIVVPIHTDKNKVDLQLSLPKAQKNNSYEDIDDRRLYGLQLESIEIIPVD